MQQPKSTAADWSQLPKELLHLISERLESPLYLLRFRSVCSSWRSSSSPSIPLHQFPINFHASTFFSDDKASTLFLSKRTLFLITPPPLPHQPIQTPIFVLIGKDLSGRTRHHDPLSSYQDLPTYPSRVLDFYHLPVFDFGNVFVLHHYPPPNKYHSTYRKKVVAATVSSCQGKQEISILLTIHLSGKKLAFFRCSEECWTLTPRMPTPYDDVCVFNGRPCAVDCDGRTVAVGSGRCLDLVAKPLHQVIQPVFGDGGDKKFLVESQGGLLLVDKHMSSRCYENDDNDGFFTARKRPVRFNVFRLDEKEKKWVEVTSLKDRVVFLGDACAFSASAASDLCVGRGNCVIFKDSALKCGIGVFPLDVGRVLPLSHHPDYSNLFNYYMLL